MPRVLVALCLLLPLTVLAGPSARYPQTNGTVQQGACLTLFSPDGTKTTTICTSNAGLVTLLNTGSVTVDTTGLLTANGGLKIPTAKAIALNAGATTTIGDETGDAAVRIATGKGVNVFTNGVKMARISDGGFGPNYGGLWIGTYTYTGNNFVSLSDGANMWFNTPSATGTITFSHNNDVANGNLVVKGGKFTFTHPTGAATNGTGTLSTGVATISTTAVTASSQIFLTVKTPGGTLGFLVAKAADITAGTSFVVRSWNSNNTANTSDTSTFSWWIIN